MEDPRCQCWNEGQWGRVHREDCPIHGLPPAESATPRQATAADIAADIDDEIERVLDYLSALKRASAALHGFGVQHRGHSGTL